MGNSETQLQAYDRLNTELKELRREMILNFQTWNHQQMESAILRAREINHELRDLLRPETPQTFNEHEKKKTQP